MSVASFDFKTILKEIRKGNVEALRKFHEKFPEIHWSSFRYEKTGDTILHVTSRLGHIDLMNYILKNYRPNTVDCKNKDNKTALHEAAQFAQFEAAQLLIENEADVNALKKADWTPLMLACTKIENVQFDENNFKIIEALLRKGAEVNYANKDGWTALHLIAREGDVRILDLLLKHNLDLNKITNNKRTALHISALHAQFDMTKKLIELGLDVNTKDSCGNTPLHDSILSGNLKIANLLLENKADLSSRNKSDFTLLDLAACRGNVEVIEYIISSLKLDVNASTSNGLTPLHCAARNQQLLAYNYLLSKGADKNIKDHFDRTPSDYLCINSENE